MSDMTDGITPVETTPRTGIDRRSALKKAAAAGAIVWVAPTILSDTAHAVDFIPGTTCTQKCTPQVSLDLVIGIGEALFLQCQAGVPGREGVRVRVTAFELAAGSSAACPCGGTPEITAGSGGPIVGQEFDAVLNPGNGILTFAVPIVVTCTDRSLDKISVVCISQAVARVTGNCRSNEGDTVGLQFLGVGCTGTVVCTPASPA